MRTVKVVNEAAERDVKQRWKLIGTTGTGLVEILRPVGQARSNTGQILLFCN